MADAHDPTISTSQRSPRSLAETHILPRDPEAGVDPAAATRRIDAQPTVLPRRDLPADAPATAGLRYETRGALGEGGIGEVLLVHDRDIDRDIAMKRLKPQMLRSDVIARFVREIRTVGRLEHPGIVPVYDVGVDRSGSYYFTMKRVDGQSLDQLIARLRAGDAEAHATWTFSRRAQLIASVAEAVGFAHSRGVIHRDLKPSNIMIGTHGEVLVLDWGLAKNLGLSAEGTDEQPALAVARDQPIDPDLTIEGDVLGTPAYMAPEQAAGKTGSLDARTDIYSLAVVLYELLTLRHPIGRRDTLAQMLSAVQEAPISFASHIASPHQPAVPHEYGHMLTTALERDPAKRFQTAGDFAGRLQSAIGGCFAAQCPVTFAKRICLGTAKLADRYPRPFVILLLLTPLALLALATLALIGLQTL